MKRFFYLLVMLIGLCALLSCEGLGLDSMFSNSISGTKWQHIEFNTATGTVHSTLSFSSSTFSLTIKQSAGTDQSYSGKYEYSGKSGTLYMDGDPAYFTVSGNYLTFLYGGIQLEFTKM